MTARPFVRFAREASFRLAVCLAWVCSAVFALGRQAVEPSPSSTLEAIHRARSALDRVRGAPVDPATLRGVLQDLRTIEVADPELGVEAATRARLYLDALEALGGLTESERRPWVEWLVFVATRANDRAKSGDGARRALKLGLELMPSQGVAWGFLAVDLAERWRQVGEHAQCEQLLDAVEGRPSAEGTSPVDQALVSRNVAGVRTQLALDLGLRDEAAHWLAEQKTRAARLKELGAFDLSTELAIDLAEANVFLASFRLSAAENRLEDWTAAQGRYAQHPAARGALLVRLGMVQVERESIDATRVKRGVATLEQALAMPELHSGDRRLALESLLDAHILDRDLESAAKILEQIESLGGDLGSHLSALEGGAFVAASRARIARLGGGSRDVLEHHCAILERAYADVLHSIDRAPKRETGLSLLHFSRRRSFIDELIELKLALHSGADGFGRAFQVATGWESHTDLAQRLKAAPASVEMLRQHLLEPGVGLLLYFPGDEVTYLFAFDRGWDGLFRLHSRYRVHEDLLELRRSLQDPPVGAVEDPSFVSAARKVASNFLPSDLVERVSGWQGIYVVGAGPLADVPFECLPLDGVALGLRARVSRLPSAAVGLATSRRDARPSEETTHDPRLLLLAAPSWSATTSGALSKQSPFALTGAQVESLSRSYGEAHRCVLMGEQATLAGLRAELKSGVTVLQVLTHGTASGARGRAAGLVLAAAGETGEVLQPSVVESLPFVPRTVLLTACRAGSTPVRFGGEGTESFASAFLAAGTSQVLLSRQDVELESTVLLSSHVHASLAKGASLAQAVREARSIVAASSEFEHPFFWASWEVWGVERADDSAAKR